MARGPAPKPADQRRNRNPKMGGEWKQTLATGWQHGDLPEPPDGLLASSRDAWSVWMGAWFAFHWTPDDLPGLRTLVKVYDQVERGEFQRAAELRMQMAEYGITPKGRQQLRWAAPDQDANQAGRKTSAKRPRLKVV